jgi:hypothetical protein
MEHQQIDTFTELGHHFHISQLSTYLSLGIYSISYCTHFSSLSSHRRHFIKQSPNSISFSFVFRMMDANYTRCHVTITYGHRFPTIFIMIVQNGNHCCKVGNYWATLATLYIRLQPLASAQLKKLASPKAGVEWTK